MMDRRKSIDIKFDDIQYTVSIPKQKGKTYPFR